MIHRRRFASLEQRMKPLLTLYVSTDPQVRLILSAAATVMTGLYSKEVLPMSETVIVALLSLIGVGKQYAGVTAI